MLNEVVKIFTDMTDLELVHAVKQIKEDASNSNGFIRENGIVREKCKVVQAIIGGNIYEHLTHVQLSILREAAYRFTPNLN